MSQPGVQTASGGSGAGKSISSVRSGRPAVNIATGLAVYASDLHISPHICDRLANRITALPSSSQPVVPSPRTSSREPPLLGDGTNGRTPDPSRSTEDGEPVQSLGVPGQSNDEWNADNSNEKAESIGRRSKRSLTGRRKRDGSAASKKSAPQPLQQNEKDMTPPSSGQTGPTSPIRPKKRGGFLSFLNCCAAPEEEKEAGQQEGAQPSKAPKPQPMRAQQPAQARPPQNVSAAGTSADESKEAFDEKAAQPGYQDGVAAAPISSTPAVEHPPPGDATADNSVPAGAPPVQPNAEVRPLEAGKQALVPEDAAAGPLQVDSSAASREAVNSGQKPDLQIQAPTPVVQQSEDELIQDRTPEQATRDNDIEMSDSGPSLPLTGQEAAIVVEEEKQAHERRESSGQQDLPPPPPRQEQQDGAAVSHDTSMVSTPEPTQKWLLPPLRQEFRGRKCLVLDLDETLVHSSFKVS